MMKFITRYPLRITIPIFLIVSMIIISTYSMIHSMRVADTEVENIGNTFVTQDMSELQGTVNSFLLEGNVEGTKMAITSRGSNPNIELILLADENNVVLQATRMEFMGLSIKQAVPSFDADLLNDAIKSMSGKTMISKKRDSIFAYYPVVIGARQQELRPSRVGILITKYDLTLQKRVKRYEIELQAWKSLSLYSLLFLSLGFFLYYVLTKRIMRLVASTKEFAAGDISVRSSLQGNDELAELGQAFDNMIDAVAMEQTERKLAQEALQDQNDELLATEEMLRVQIVEYEISQAQRKKAGESLQESKELFKSLIENLSVGVVMIDPGMRIIMINPRILDLFPSFDPTMKPLCYSVFNTPPRNEPCVGCPVLKTLRDGGRYVGEREVSICDKIHVISMMSSAITDRNGSITAAIEIIDDITERKGLEAQLHQAQKMESVGRLAGGVAHDFNNILTVILGYSQLGLMESDPTTPIYAQLEEIEKAGERATELTHQLLAFARKQAIQPKVIQLNETVAGMLKMLQRLIGENIQLNWIAAENLWLLMIDPSQIDQLMANLCVNARDAITDVGKITIETENCTIGEDYSVLHIEVSPGEYVRLAVSDNGSGIDRETLTHIFEPFFTTKAAGEGTGLGLATVFGIVKQNNGFINVYSEPGLGTTFSIHLPRHIGKSEQVQDTVLEVTAPHGSETILLVEDDATILRLATVILNDLGYTVLQANTPNEAIQLAKEHAGNVKLLITDVIMPEMNGKELANKLQTLYPQLKCLFMSGYTDAAIAKHGVLDEGVHFVQKPFTLSKMAVKVREVLDSK